MNSFAHMTHTLFNRNESDGFMAIPDTRLDLIISTIRNGRTTEVSE